jgi:hypothetical protein
MAATNKSKSKDSAPAKPEIITDKAEIMKNVMKCNAKQKTKK